jgi:hypothetical protein
VFFVLGQYKSAKARLKNQSGLVRQVDMEAARKISLKQKVHSFISDMTQVQKMIEEKKLTQEASLATLVIESQRLLRALHQVTVSEELLSRVENLYESHASKYNEILQLLICERIQQVSERGQTTFFKEDGYRESESALFQRHASRGREDV